MVGFRQRIHLVQHVLVVIQRIAVDGEHAARFADAKAVLAAQLVVHIARQRRQVMNLRHHCFAVHHRLHKVRNRPALRDVEAQQGGQLFRRLCRHGVAPSAELRQLLPVFIKGEEAVHHAGYAERRQIRQRHAIIRLHVLLQIRERILHARPHVIQVICPNAVLQPILPCMVAGCNRRVVVANQHRLDARRAELNAQHRFSVRNICGNCFVIHDVPSSSF